MKKILSIVVLLLFTAAALFAVLLILKPGASFLQLRQKFYAADFKPYDRHDFYLPLDINVRIFPPSGMLLFEDGERLEKTPPARVINRGRGRYAILDDNDGQFNLVFSPTGNDDPSSNGRQYTLLFKPVFFNRTAGISLLVLLGLGLAWFLWFVIRQPAGRETLLSNPVAILDLWNEFLTDAVPRVINPVTNREPAYQSRLEPWILLVLLTIGASFTYMFMEWIFFVTKHSFMDLMGWGEKIEILLTSSFGLTLSGLLLVLVFAALDWLTSRFRRVWVFIFGASLVPTLILGALALILVDNFTYTIFNFGIVSSDGVVRFLYGLGFIFICIYINRWTLGLLGMRSESPALFQVPRFITITSLALCLLSAVVSISLIVSGYQNSALQLSGTRQASLAASSQPNIILIGSDGLNASHMSLYGYERNTTPVLSQLAETSLLAENAFSNASNSEGSVISILTGKSPAQTRVLYPPNILEGADSIEHLPGILRDEGYISIEMGVPHYVDAFKANLLEGFSVVNEREIEEKQGVRLARRLGLGNASYFVSLLSERIIDRTGHIFFIHNMNNPFTAVTQTPDIQHDSDQMEQLSALIQESESPFFAHVHLMGTHGPQFDPQEKKFSSGKSQEEEWDIDFYDDSILIFDGYMGELLDVLEQQGEIDNTILIVYSDHPMQFNVRWRMPLLFHFPDDQYAGRVKANVQNLDIAPTILDYLGIEQPEWMEGQSLINEIIGDDRLIFSSGTNKLARGEESRWEIESAQVKAPFYQFSFFNLINCHKWYWFDLTTLTWESGEVPGHTRPCSDEDLLTLEEIERALAAYLTANRFDISTLPFE